MKCTSDGTGELVREGEVSRKKGWNTHVHVQGWRDRWEQ